MSITVVTAADRRMKPMVQFSLARADRLGYDWLVYDLGDLGFGCPHFVENELFRTQGHYGYANKQIGWKSRAVHKPAVLLHAFGTLPDNAWVIYLDADASLVHPVPEIVGDYDIGITVRKAGRFGRINAGVVFLNNSAAVREFVETWQQETDIIGNDQKALGHLIDTTSRAVKEFPCSVYNYYDFPPWPGKDVKIVHFKGHARPYFEKYRQAQQLISSKQQSRSGEFFSA